MESRPNNFNITFYIPLRNQVAKAMTALLFFLLFGSFQWIRMDQPGQFGIVDYWRFSLPHIPNDYKLIVISSAVSILILFISLISTLINKENNSKRFLILLIDIIPTIGNLLIVVFFFYLIFYRGFWSLSEFKNGFSFIPILKLMFFTSCGVYGYMGFVHFYQLKKLIQQSKAEELITYIARYKLNNI